MLTALALNESAKLLTSRKVDMGKTELDLTILDNYKVTFIPDRGPG
jgi:hypothetical protein